MIGIYGGSFDPVHWGHIRPLQAAAKLLQLSQVRYIPAKIPPHKDIPSAPEQHRIKMLELALDGTDFRVDRREIERGGTSWTVNTLQSLKQELPHETLVLLMGTDTWNGFPDWKQPQRILELAHIAILARPGYQRNEPGIAGEWADGIPSLDRQSAGLLITIEAPLLDISSTLIRQRLQNGDSLQELLPAPVASYIRKHNLYTGSHPLPRE